MPKHENLDYILETLKTNEVKFYSDWNYLSLDNDHSLIYTSGASLQNFMEEKIFLPLQSLPNSKWISYLEFVDKIKFLPDAILYKIVDTVEDWDNTEENQRKNLFQFLAKIGAFHSLLYLSNKLNYSSEYIKISKQKMNMDFSKKYNPLLDEGKRNKDIEFNIVNIISLIIDFVKKKKRYCSLSNIMDLSESIIKNDLQEADYYFKSWFYRTYAMIPMLLKDYENMNKYMDHAEQFARMTDNKVLKKEILYPTLQSRFREFLLCDDKTNSLKYLNEMMENNKNDAMPYIEKYKLTGDIDVLIAGMKNCYPPSNILLAEMYYFSTKNNLTNMEKLYFSKNLFSHFPTRKIMMEIQNTNNDNKDFVKEKMGQFKEKIEKIPFLEQQILTAVRE